MAVFTNVFLLALTATAAILRRDAITVQNDITQKIGPQTTTLLNDINGYPASGLSGALAIHIDIQGLAGTVNNAANDVKSSGSFSEADGTAILTDFEDFESTFLETLAAIGNQAPAWTSVPGGQALVFSDLNELNASFTGFISALLGAAPIDLVPAFTSVETQIVGGFNKAIAAYSPE